MYTIKMPKELNYINIKKDHERKSQAYAHVIDMLSKNKKLDLIMAEDDPVDDGYDFAVSFNHGYNTQVSIIAINRSH